MNITSKQSNDTHSAVQSRNGYINHFFAGEIAGMCAAVTSFPMDTIKTRIQIEMIQNKTDIPKPSTFSILRHILVHDGIRNMYKGVLFPFIGYGVASSFVFGINNMAKTFVLQRKQRRCNMESDQSSIRRLTLSEISLCGTFTGFINSFVVCPIERVKTYCQSHHTKSIYSAKALYKEMGILKGFYSGIRVFCCFQIVSFSAYFPIYELSLKMLTTKRDPVTNQWRSAYIIGDLSTLNKEKVSSLQILLSGGIAGVFSWIVGFPIDNIKTRVQSGLYSKSSLELIRKQSISWRNAYQGIMPTIYRAAVLHSTIFLVYERTLLLAHQYNPPYLDSLSLEDSE